MRLIDRVALVTGGSRGIGREIALRLASEGCHVAVAARQTDLLDELVERIGNIGCKGLAVKMDMTRNQDINRGVQRVKKRFGRIDILVNNAGIGYRAPLEDMRTQDINEMFSVNVSGAIECCRRVIPIMKEQHSGCIINVAAAAGTVGVPSMAAYAASKWALRGLGLSLALELKADNIHVHNVCPGRVDTDFYEDFDEDDPVRLEDPELRLKPDDVAQAVVYLATLPERCQVDELIVGARRLG